MSNRPQAPGGNHSGVPSGAKGALKGALTLGLFVAAAVAGAQTDLGSGQVRIIGTGLDVTPQAQTVPIGIPTIVQTHLQAPPGSLPASVTVRAELTGPGVPGSLQLSAEPNGSFVIPAQSVRGTYALSNIRLMDGVSFLSYSAHRDATITVTDILIASVTSRPLTYQEMIDKGIVVSSKNFRAYSFVFALQIQGRLQEFEVPVVFPEFGPPILPSIPRATGTTPLPEFFSPPQVRSVRWGCGDLAADVAKGLQYIKWLGPPIELPCGFSISGGDQQQGGGSPDTRPVLLSLLLIPGDVAFLNQFFSLSVLVQNGAPAGTNLRLENITAKASLPLALRGAETNPPTNFSDPVPIVDPGPDGKLGTADDVTFLLAQSVGKAEFLMEGLRSGRWDVPIDLQATLTGLPAGPVPLKGSTVGSVLVRNPSFFVTLDHPDVIREGEAYTISATVTNTSSVPANQVSIKLDKAFITGADLLSAETVALGNLAPSNSAVAKFQLNALRTGRVTSDAFFGEGTLSGSVVLHAGVGELSIPLSPDTLVFPRSVDQLPSSLVDPARRLLGLAWSIAKSPDGTAPAGLPQVGEQATRWRVNDLILAARHRDLGETESTALSDFLLGWLNAGAEQSVGFDQLRRASAKGSDLAAAWGQELTQFWQQEAPFDYQKRIARSLPDKSFLSAVVSTGSDAQNPSARLVLSGKVVPGRAQLFSGETGFERTLPSAELFRASRAGSQYEAGWIGSPDPGGYQVQIAGKRADSVTLTVTYPAASGKIVFASFGPFPVVTGSLAWIDIIPGVDPAQLTLQETNFAPLPGAIQLEPRPALQLLAAVQDLEADPRGHAISLLFNRSLPAGGATGEKANYEVRSSFGVNGTAIVQHQLVAGDPRRVIVGVMNHPSPYVTSTVRVAQLIDAGGSPQSPDPQIVNLIVRDSRPGGSVEGVVIGANGQPAASALVVMRVTEVSDTTGQTFYDDFATATADGAGKFFFEYVQIRQGQVFQLSAADPATGFDGEAYGQVRTEAERVTVNVVLLGRGDVEGRVVDESGAAIANAYVTAESVFIKGNRNHGSNNSGGDGSFSFKALPVGPVQLWAIDPASRKTAYQVASIPGAGGKVTQNLVIVRTPRASISGDVIHEGNHQLAAGLYVVAYGESVVVPYPPGSDRKYFGYRVTDSNGRFSFADVQSGADLVQVYDFSRSSSPVLEYTLQIVPDSDTVLHLVVLEPQTRTGSVEGYVRLNTGGTLSPLANVVMTVSASLSLALTDATGYYRLDGVAVGSPSVTAYDPGTQRQQRQSVTVQEGLVSPLDFAFGAVNPPSKTILGTVLDAFDRPVANATVAEFDGSGNVLRSAIADGTGSFVFNDVPPGNHAFSALGRDDTSGSLRDDVGAASVSFAGTGEGSLTIRLAGWGTVRGKVVGNHLDDVGNPIDSPISARLVLSAPQLVKIGQFGLIAGSTHPLYPGNRETDSSAGDGTYSFTDVLGGAFSLLAHHPVYGDKTVVATVGANQTFVQDFRYDNALSWIDGYLYDQNGNPILAADVDLWRGAAPADRTDPHNPPYATVKTISEPSDGRGLGYFRFVALPNSSFTLSFSETANGVQRFDQAYVTVAGAPHGLRVTLRTRVVQDVRVLVLQPDQDNELQPVAGASVKVTETDWPHRSFRADTDPTGTIVFHGVSEGRFTVNAQSVSQAGTAGGCVCVEGGVVDAVVTLPGSGSAAGTVLFPGTGAPVSSAQVLILDGGLPVGATQTDASGQYRIDGLQLNRSFAVRVKDNASARFGFGANFVLSSNGEVQTRDVTLLALGFVTGVFTNGGGMPIAGATVELVSNSILGQTKFYSGTDGQGHFSFSGIPQGTYSLSSQDPVTKLSGGNQGEIVTEALTVATNLRAQASGIFDVSVHDAAGGSLTLPPVLTLRAPGVPPRTVIASQFSFTDVPLGAYSLTAEEQVSSLKHRAALSGRISANGEVQALEMRYVPYGSVNVRVIRVALDGTQGPAARGRVALVGAAPYDGQFPFGSWVNLNTATGVASFVQVGGGTISASYFDPVTQRTTSGSGQLTVEGDTIEIVVLALDTSSTISGRVLKPAPQSSEPAAGTFISLGSRTVLADGTGRFAFTDIPFGNYTLALQSTTPAGKLSISVSLSAQDAPLELGDLVLDGAPPTIVSFGPPDGTTGVPRAATIAAQFSEPIQVLHPSFFLALGPDHTRTGSVSLSADRKTAYWAASPPLLPGTTYRILIRLDAVADDNGWPMGSGYSSSFTTIDDKGPSVVQVAPMPGAIQVPVSATVIAVFDSALDPASVRPGTVLLEKIRPSSGVVVGTIQESQDALAVIFRPDAPLDSEAAYRVTIAGLRDTAGNGMYVPYVFTFGTRDDVFPSVNFDPPPAPSFYTGNYYRLGLTWTSNDIRTIQIKINGHDGPALSPSATDRSATFTDFVGDSASPRVYAATPTDFSGNTGPTARLSVPVIVEAPPAVSIQVTSPTPLAPGGLLTGRLLASDDRGLSSLSLSVSGPFWESLYWTDVAGTTSATRDFSIPVPITAGAGGVVKLEAWARDNNVSAQYTRAVNTTVSITRDTVAPTIANLTPASGTSVVPGDRVVVSANVTDDLAVKSVSLNQPGAFFWNQTGNRLSMGFLAPTVPGDISVVMTAVDYGGNSTSAAPILLHVISDDPPTGTLTIQPAGPILPNNVFSIIVTARDDHGLKMITFRTNPPCLAAGYTDPYLSGLSGSKTFSQRVPAGLAPGAIVSVFTDIQDISGHTTTIGPATVTVGSDTIPPRLGGASPADGSTLTSGQKVNVGISVSDDVWVARVDITVDGVTTTIPGVSQTSWTYQIPYSAKFVAAPTLVPVRFVAWDTAGNSAFLESSFTVVPNTNPAGPKVAMACPTNGALLPAGYTLAVTADASDDQGVERVEFYAGADAAPFATVRAAPYSANYSIPSGLVDGDLLALRAKAYDFAGNSVESVAVATIAAGIVLSSNTTIPYGNDPRDGKTLIVAGGTTTIEGQHSFARVIVLSGATVTQSPTTLDAVSSLEIDVSGKVYVACGGSIDVSGKGYWPNRTFPNIQTSFWNTGGSYGGKGYSLYSVSADVYGSFADPKEPGSGAGFDTGAGGGVLRLHAQSLIVDGVLSSGGTHSWGGWGGAGGAIRLDASSLSGSGSIRAPGDGGAGGGRIAVYGNASGFNRGRVQAIGGGGGAGTVFFRSSTQLNGDLIVDNGGWPAGMPTSLPSIGAGSITSVSGSTITDASKTFSYSVVGLSVDLKRGSAVLGTYRVIAQSGGSLTLDREVGGVQAEDTYQGVLLVDNLIVRGGAQFTTADISRVVAAPTGTLSFTPASPVLPGKTISVAVAAADGAGLTGIVFSASGAVTSSQTLTASGTSATGNFNVALPVTAVAGSTVNLIADITDTDGNVTRVGPAVVTVAADTTPPGLSNPRPADGANLISGASVSVGVEAEDDVGVLSVDVIVDSVTTRKTAAPYQVTYTAKSVAAVTAVPVQFVARDRAGNTKTLDRSIVIVPISGLVVNPASVISGTPAQGDVTIASPATGSGVTLTLTSSDTSAATVPSSVLVPAGQTTAPFPVTTRGVASASTVNISAGVGTVTRSVPFTVNPASLASVTLTPSTMTGKDISIAGRVTLDGLAPPLGATVNLTSGNVSAATVPASVKVASGTTSVPFTATSNEIPAPSTFDVTATYNGVSQSATLTVYPSSALASVTLSAPSVLGGGSVTGTVTLTFPAPSSGVSVTLASENTGAATVGPGVFVLPGTVSRTFPVTTHAVGTTATFNISAAYNGVTQRAPLTVTAAALTSLKLTPSSVVGSGLSVTGKVTLDGIAPAAGAQVALFSGNTSAATVPASVPIFGGQSSATFQVTTKPLSTSATLEINASYNGATVSATLTVDRTVAPPLGELTEGDAASWGTFASDGRATSVADDTTRVKVGAISLRFDTASGYDTGVRYPAAGSLHWDLTGRSSLVFWTYAVNSNPLAFQGNQPVVVLNSPFGSFRYVPQTDPAMTLDAWHQYQVPLAGSADWLLTTAGSPSMSDITSLEIHQDTWDLGFTIWYDGLKFLLPPTVSITSPVAGTNFLPPANVTIIATASDSDGSVAKVEFLQGTTKLGEDTTSPYSFAWSNVAAGSYSLTAKATDNLGATTTSAAVNITVDSAPTVSITSPVNGATFAAPASITITASATDAGGSVAKVEFFQGTTKLGEDTTSPFRFAWTNVPAGSYALTARATDNLGVSRTSAAVTITVDNPPTVSITSPIAGTNFLPPANVTMTATASDSDGSVAKVEFFHGTTKLGEAMTSPYSFSWSNVAAGSYSLTAKATDDRGATTTSVAVSVTVNNAPMVSITSPISGAMFSAPASITITASATDTGGSVAKVEFFQGTTKLGEDTASSYSFAWTNVPAGSYTLTARATDNLGTQTTSAPVSITVATPVLISLTLTQNSVVGGISVTGMVSLNAPAPSLGGAVVSLTSGNTAAATVLASVTVPKDATTATFAVTTRAVTASATFDITATYGATQKASLTVTPAASLDSLTLDQSSVTGGVPVTATVTLNGKAPAGGVPVSVASANPSAAVPVPNPPTVTVPAGATVVTFTVKTFTVPAPATFNISVSSNGVARTAPLTVVNPSLPKVAIKCPTNGAMFPPGYPLTVSVEASDDQGIDRVEFSLNGDTTPFATDTTAPYQTTYTVPAGLLDGAIFTLKAKAYDAAGNTAESVSSVTVVTPTVPGDVISTATTIAADDSSHDGHTLIVASGTSTIVGTHSFERLIILEGAKVTHPPDTSSTVGSLAIQVTGSVYVACGGAIDVSGSGYLGGPLNGQGWTYSNLPGSQSGAGGSHGGLGGDNSGNLAAQSYGSLFLGQIPAQELAGEAGGGGGGLSDSVGGTGGGSVRLLAGPAVIVDGAILTDGASGQRAGGAGGAIRIDANRLSGSGVIRAAGGVSGRSDAASGGGGRVALRYANSDFDRARVTAPGGNGGIGSGGAGTVYFKADSQAYGELVVDNAGTVGAYTPLPSIGSGALTGISVDRLTVTDSSKTFPYAVAGLFVEIRHSGALVGTYRVTSQSGGSLTVDQAIPAAVVVGDPYQGVVKLDNLVVANGAHLTTNDSIAIGVASLTLSPTNVLGGASATGTVTLTGPAPAAGAVVALSSGNTAAATVPNPPIVTVPAGQAAATFPVTSKAVATSVSFNVTASYGGSTQAAQMTVTPAVLTSATLSPTTVIGGNTVPGTVALNGLAPTGGAVVALSSSNSAAATVPASVTVAAGASTAPFTVTTLAVTAAATVNIKASYNGVDQTAPPLTVQPPALSSLVLNPTGVAGGVSSTGTVTLTGKAPTGGVIVTFTSSNTTVVPKPANVTVLAGKTTATGTVTTTPVAASTQVTITASYGGVNQLAVLTVQPPALQSLALNPTSVLGGVSSTATVMLTGKAPTGGVVVAVSSANPAVAAVPGPTVTVLAGQTTATFAVTTTPVATSTPVIITASYSGVNQLAVLTVQPPALSSLTLNPTSVLGGVSSTGTVTLTGKAPAGDVVVNLSSGTPAAATVPATVKVLAGQTTSAPFTVTTYPVAASTKMTITATYNGGNKPATLTVTPPALSSLTLSPTSVKGGSANSTATVTLTGNAPAAGIVVTLSSANTGAATVPASVTVSGTNTATFTVTSKVVTTSVTFNTSATYGVTKSAPLTVTP